MKTEDLKAQGFTDEQIKFIMAENGKDIEKYKAESETYKSQLDDAKTTLKSFDGVDVNELKGQITKLNTDLTTKETEFQSKLSEIEFKSSLEKAVIGSKAKNAKAVMALLDVDNLKSSKNQQTDISTALEKIKQENDYLFEGEQQPKRAVGLTLGATTTQAENTTAKANEAFRGLFSKGE